MLRALGSAASPRTSLPGEVRHFGDSAPQTQETRQAIAGLSSMATGSVKPSTLQPAVAKDREGRRRKKCIRQQLGAKQGALPRSCLAFFGRGPLEFGPCCT